MTKKMIRNIIIAVLVIAALSALCYFALVWNPESENKIETTNTTTEEISIVRLDYSKLTQLDIQNRKGEYTIKKDGSSFSIDGYDNETITQAKLAGPFMKLENLTAERLIDSAGDVDQFGFDEPQAVVIARDEQGIVAEILVGEVDPTVTGYYVKERNDDKIYLVSQVKINDFLLGVSDYRNKLIANFDFDTMKSLEIEKGDEKIVSVRLRNESDKLTDIVIERHIMTYPYYGYVSLEELSVPFEEITSVEAVDIVSDTASDADAYGIGAYTIRYSDDYGTHVIKFGDIDENGNVYAFYEGVDTIYTFSKEWYNAVSEFKPFDYLYKLTHIHLIDETSEVIYDCPEGKLTFSSSGGVYKVNGTEIDSTIYKDAYSEIMSMSFTGDGKDVIPGEKVGSITFTVNGNVMEYGYFEADERNYLVVRPDGFKFLVLKKNYDPVFGKIKAIIGGI